MAIEPEILEQTYAEWLFGATKAIAEFRRAGVVRKKLDVDVQELAQWCRDHGRALDGAARAMFVTEEMSG